MPAHRRELAYRPPPISPRLSPAQVRYWEQTFKQVTDSPQWAAFLAKNHWKPHFLESAQTRKYLDEEADSARVVLGELGLLKP